MYEPVEHTQTFNLCSFLDRAEQLGAVFARTRNLYIQAPGSCEPVQFSFRCCTPAPGDFLGIVTEVGSSWTLLNSRTLGVFWSRIFHKPLASLRFVTLHGNSSRSGCFVSRPQRLLRWSAKLLQCLSQSSTNARVITVRMGVLAMASKIIALDSELKVFCVLVGGRHSLFHDM